MIAVCRRKSLLALALIGAGALLLLYVAVQYGKMYAAQEHLAKEWKKQNEQSRQGPVHISVDDGLTKLFIPRIGLDAIVVEGTTRKQLLLGPGHMVETPRPGDTGNAVITAHRDTFFRHIYELNKGDNIEIRRSGQIYTYEVTGKKVIDPEDLSVLHQGSDKRLTLITCYPTYYIGPAPDRLVVFARMVERVSSADRPPPVPKKTMAASQ